MCAACGQDIPTSEMTDGRTSYALCDLCRPLVVTFFHVYGQMQMAVNEARQTRRLPPLVGDGDTPGR